MAVSKSTREDLLEISQNYIQTTGINGFSYADLARDLGIRKPSIHHHFPKKADLCAAVAAHAAVKVQATRERLKKRNLRASEQLKVFLRGYVTIADSQRNCLPGMMSAEWVSLSEDARHQVGRYVELMTGWLQEILEQGNRDGSLQRCAQPAGKAALLTAALQGGLQMDKVSRQKQFQTIRKQILLELIPSKTKPEARSTK